MMRGNCLLLAAVVVCVSACSKSEVPEASVPEPTVYTVNYPLAYFAERIAGDTVTVVFPEIAGDPAFWNPSAEDVSRYQQADLILLNGASYAKWVAMVSLAPRKLVDTSAAYQDQLISAAGEGAHQHGPGDVHAHGEVAFTTWLDPLLAIEQAAAIHGTLSARWPQDRAIFDAGFQGLKQDLLELDAAFAFAFQEKAGVQLIGSHPVYQYLSRRYGLNMSSVHWEPQVALDDAMLREPAGLLQADSTHVMLWEDNPLPESKSMLLSVGVESIVFCPCANRPEVGDYLSVMQQNVLNVTAE